MDDSIARTMKSLEKNGIKSRYFETSNDAAEYLAGVIPEDASVGIGGSVTINNLGIIEKLKKRGNKILFHWLSSSPEESKKIRYEALKADIYMSSTNALTMDGKLVNMDGAGNRVAGMFFGPPKVYIVCGKNKIVENVDKAFERIENNAYKNAVRLKLNTPCIRTKKCTDCNSPDRMCNVAVIINRKPSFTDIEVVIINEELGF